MPVVDVRHDTDALTLTIVAEFAAPVPRVWQIYADPRQLERVWGPREYPETLVEHELKPGGRVGYYMTSPEGERFHGLWQVESVAEPDRFTFDDYFATADFTPNSDLPVSRCDYRFEAMEGGTRATYVSSYASAADLQQVLDMGVVEGASSALGQIDDLLAA